ncbi:hypothetical protein D3C78_1770090 [compost metagenome]
MAGSKGGQAQFFHRAALLPVAIASVVHHHATPDVDAVVCIAMTRRDQVCAEVRLCIGGEARCQYVRAAGGLRRCLRRFTGGCHHRLHCRPLPGHAL